MNITIVTEDKYKESWNKIANHVLQSWEWGEIKKRYGNKIYRIGVFDDKNKLIQVYLFTLHFSPIGYSLINFARGEWPPIEVLRFLYQKTKHLKCIFFKLEPNVFLGEAGKYKIPLLNRSWNQNNLNYVLSSSRIFAQHTFVNDLNFSETELLAFMKSKTRYNIKLAQKKGVQIKDESINPQGFNIFFKLYSETIKRQNYLGHNYNYHKVVWETMFKANLARILVAYFNKQPIAAYQLFYFKDTAYYLYGGTSQAHKEVMASNLLMWEAIKQAKQNGYQYFDMWGALEKDYNPKHSWAGFHRFKEGYGGIHKSYLPTIDVVFKSLEYQFFSLAWPIRNKLVELKQKYL